MLIIKILTIQRNNDEYLTMILFYILVFTICKRESHLREGVCGGQQDVLRLQVAVGDLFQM